MGAVTFSVDPNLVKALSRCLPFDVFVETGTFCGETIEIVSDYFKHIYSIELSKHYFDIAQEKFAQSSHVTLYNDDAVSALQALVPQLQDRAVVYWLDAHWCVADATAGQTSQCPLLQELSTIHQLNEESMIIIDDARLFLSAPQKPHEISNWPSFHEIVVSLFKLSQQHQIAVLNDCILFYPESIHAQIRQFSHDKGIDWLDMLNRLRSSEKQLAQVSEQMARVSQENQRLHHLNVWQRVRGILGYIWRHYGIKKNQFASPKTD